MGDVLYLPSEQELAVRLVKKCDLKKTIKQNLFFLSTLQVSPLLQRLAQIHAVHGDLYLTDHVVFGETVKVKNLQHQSLSTQLCIRDLER